MLTVVINYLGVRGGGRVGGDWLQLSVCELGAPQRSLSCALYSERTPSWFSILNTNKQSLLETNVCFSVDEIVWMILF